MCLTIFQLSTLCIKRKGEGGGGGRRDSEGTDKRIKREPERGSPFDAFHTFFRYFRTSSILLQYVSKT